MNEATGKAKTIYYVDGYNWYHAIFKHHPEWKWLNIESFLKSLRPHEEVTKIRLFSAMVDAFKREKTEAFVRQETYFKALWTLPLIEITLGVFQPRRVTCGGSCKEKYDVPEEKKTDVNIAVAMISDAIAGGVDRMCVVSGDSDVQPVVEWIVKHRPGIKITVYIPCLPNEQRDRRTDYYATRGLDVECRFLPLGNLGQHQLRTPFNIGNGFFVHRPSSWTVSGLK